MNLKKKLSKQAEQKQNHRSRDLLKGYQLGKGRERRAKASIVEGKYMPKYIL